MDVPGRRAPRMWPRRIRTRLIAGVAAVQLVLATVFVIGLVERQRQFLRRESLERTGVLASALAVNSASWVVANDVVGLDEVVRSVERDPDVGYAMVVTREGQVLAHTDRSLVGLTPSDPPSAALLARAPELQTVAATRDLLDVAAPVTTAGGVWVGWARVGMKQTRIHESLADVLRFGVAFGAVAVLFGSLLAVAIGNRLTSGLGELLRVSAQIRDGRRDVRANAAGEDEVADLGRGLNEMIDALAGTQEALAEQSRLLESFFAHTQTCLVLLDPAFNFIRVNEAYARACARDASSFFGRNHFDLYPSEELRARFEEVVRTRRSYRVFGRPFSFPDHPEWGTTYWDLVVFPILGAGDSVEFLVFSLQDVTDRIEAEEALKRSEEKYRLFFEEDLAGHFITTPDGRILACNPAFARTLGFASPAEARATNIGTMYASREERERLLAELRARRRVERVESEFVRKDGRPAHVIQSAIGTFDGTGALVEIHGLLIDETERWEAEQGLRQAQKMEAVGRLAGGVAHDFNNLLTIILGYLDLLRPSLAESDPRRADLAEIEAAAQRAAALTRQLLAFSRKQVLRPAVLDLNETVRGVEKMVRRLIGENIRLTTDLAPDLGRVVADQGQIEQVLVNLVVNARDAMPDGGDLTISTANVAGAAHVLLAVRDTGSGMSRETQTKIFEPFFTTKEPGTGTGLGLATVYGIVKQSGGDVRVESEPGKGSTFRVLLPRADETAETRPEPAAATEDAKGSGSVAIVEDDLALRGLTSKILEEAGYEVLVTGGPEEVLALAERHAGRIDLLLADVVMPGMSGTEVARRFVARHPETRILYMSGYTDREIARQGVLAPGVQLLQKPFTRSGLLAGIRQALESPSPSPVATS